MVVDGMYLQLHDDMVGEYLTILLNTSLKGWNARWFYMKQSHPTIRCDVDHVMENQKSWSEKSSSGDMDQVKELLGLIKGREDERRTGGGELHSAPCSAQQGEGPRGL